MSYSNPISSVYRFPAQSVIAAAELARIVGPKGLTGRLVSVATVVTTGVTVASSSVIVGSAGDADAYGSLTVPVSAANALNNTMSRGVTDFIPADTAVVVGSGGGATAGACDILVHIDWS
jgi:hypothetical protein